MTRAEALCILVFAERFYRYGQLQREDVVAAWLFLNGNKR